MSKGKEFRDPIGTSRTPWAIRNHSEKLEKWGRQSLVRLPELKVSCSGEKV